MIDRTQVQEYVMHNSQMSLFLSGIQNYKKIIQVGPAKVRPADIFDGNI